MEQIKKLVLAKKLQGIADIKDLSDRQHGLRLVIEVKNGFVPEALLEQLYRQTALEDTFGINAVALVDGQPRTLGLIQMLEVFLAHRFDVVRRRSLHRRAKAADRLHLVDGLLIAILDIDEVIQVIRSSDNAAAAKERLISVFELSEAQADYILDMPLRRLTRFSKLELDKEKDELERTIEHLDAILADEKLLRKVVSDELADVAKAARHAPSDGAAGLGRHHRHRRDGELAGGGRRPLLRLPLLQRPAGPDVLGRAPRPRRGPGQPRRRGQRRTHHRPRRGRRADQSRPAGQGGRPRHARAARLGQRPQPPGRPSAQRDPLPRGRRARAGPDLAAHRRARPGARHAGRRREAGEPRGARPRRVGGHRPQGRRRGHRRRRAAPRARRSSASSPPTPSCCTSRPAAYVRRAGPAAAWPASSSARASTPRSSVPSTRPTRSSSRRPAPPRHCPAPRRARSRSPRSASTPARAAPPAASAATASSRARTSSSPPGRGRVRPGPPRPAVRPSTCPRPTGRRDGSGIPAPQPIAAVSSPVAAQVARHRRPRPVEG